MFHQLPTYTAASPLSATQPPPPPLPSAPRLDLSRVPPTQHTAAYEYDSFVARLTFNSKDLITTLTRVAGENPHNAEGIAAVLEQRVLAAPPTVKLPMLYLLDSIVKNIGGPYIATFCVNLFHTFTTAYLNTTQQVRMSMHRLLNTWPPVFGLEVVTAMRRRAADIDAVSQTQPPHPLQPQGYQGLQMPHGLTMPQGLQVPPPPHQPLMPRSGVPMSRPPPQVIIPPVPVAVPTIVSASMPARPMLLNNQQQRGEGNFHHVVSLMRDISRKASMGIPPSNHQLFTINRLITTLLSNAHSSQREMLLNFQSQLRELPTRLASNAPQSFPPPSVAYPGPVPPPVPASDALNNIFSKLPPNFLAATSQSSDLPASLNDVRIPRHSVLPARSQLPIQPDLPKVLKFADLKTMSHAAAVRALYADLPHLSKADGMRFSTKEALREHLDWLFQKNRSKRARERGTSVGGSSRCWFESVKKILGGENGKDGEDEVGSEGFGVGGNLDNGKKGAKTSTAIVATGASEKCEACQEEIDSFWSDEDQAWMLRDAIRTDDSEVYHKTCVESTTASSPRHTNDRSESMGGSKEVEVKEVVAMDGVGAKAEVTAVKDEVSVVKAEAASVKTEEKLAKVTLGNNATIEENLSKKRSREEDQQTSKASGCGNPSSVLDESPLKRAKVEKSVVQ